MTTPTEQPILPSTATVNDALRTLTHDGRATTLTSILPHGGPKVPAALEALTERERDVLELICDGYSNAEIAEELGYGGTWAPQTVGRMTSNVMLKLKARNRAHAVALAIRSGLIEAAA